MPIVTRNMSQRTALRAKKTTRVVKKPTRGSSDPTRKRDKKRTPHRSTKGRPEQPKRRHGVSSARYNFRHLPLPSPLSEEPALSPSSTPPSNTAAVQTLRFLALPGEVRNVIYELFVQRSVKSVHRRPATNDAPAVEVVRKESLNQHDPSNILLTCRRINAEAFPIYCEYNAFSFEDPITFANNFLRTITCRKLFQLRHLVFEIKGVVGSAIFRPPCVNGATIVSSRIGNRKELEERLLHQLANVLDTYWELSSLYSFRIDLQMNEFFLHDHELARSDEYRRLPEEAYVQSLWNRVPEARLLTNWGHHRSHYMVYWARWNARDSKLWRLFKNQMLKWNSLYCDTGWTMENHLHFERSESQPSNSEEAFFSLTLKPPC